eukprot:Blabericola_migrator_1__11117@NODE_649_length_7061_cov_165_821132_g475_i0_p2_GENE_NODE_649_length_7061_cov_165_821132_g475_i0NODE_649_length_7061_cov_165_821132_g475_i0_p2_ORF_typecomplete_len638_score93_83EMP70/PF02990_16/1_4e198DUF5133/PF17196_4/1_9DUF5133/PF17196_4/1e03PIRT/PF15099_6/1_2e04PIRT/PF15099_6/0_26TMEM192/PF14802_6/1_2TMEM192/PF14802_6/7_2e02TMEM192/PF14802_6/90_NODE_649_length_7061_cov_165_821132_g475_i039095822
MRVALVVLSALQGSTGFYLPGNAPNAYDKGAIVPIQVNKMTSARTQVPYGYYSLDFCAPETVITSSENLGQILKGDLIQNTPYTVRMKVEDTCHTLCVKQVTAESLKQFKGMIDDEYYVNLLADDLPAALLQPSPVGQKLMVGGYPLGVKETKDRLDTVATQLVNSKSASYYLTNHLELHLKYHDTPEGARVVGFNVEPRSMAHQIIVPTGTNDTASATCSEDSAPLDLQMLHAGDQIAYTYSVHFEESPVEWATRWDAYLNATSSSAQIHWFSIVNAFVVVMMLSGIIGTIMLRTLLRDIARYNALDDIEDAQEESGWKLVHGDVFRRPNFSKLLATCAGTGVQVLIMSALTLSFALLGLLSPANRGALLQAMLLLFAFMGGPAGYVSARFNKLFQGPETDRSFIVTLWTAFQYTGICFTTFLCINTLLWFKGSSGAVPFRYLFLLVLLWLGVSVPLVFIGAYMGYRKPCIDLPVRTNQIPRQIPKSPLFLRPAVTLAMGGILPFGAVFSELSFIMTSVWHHKFYYLFGFLTLVMIILVVTCAETSIVFTYFQLVAEDYRWWWRSYWVSAFAAVYYFLFSILYFYDSLEITSFTSTILYFGYNALIAYTFFLLTGAVGFISSFWFVRAIYGAVKVD